MRKIIIVFVVALVFLALAGNVSAYYSSCSRDDLRGKTCSDFGFRGGTLGCDYEGKFDVSQCYSYCSNGYCYGSPRGGYGSTSCHNIYNKLSCEEIGCDWQGSGNLCEGDSLNGKTCPNFISIFGNPFILGVLECNNNCGFDVSGCEEGINCGNGQLDYGEQCEGSNFGGESCLSLNFSTGDLKCKSDCTIDTSQCSNSGGGDGTCNDPFTKCEGIGCVNLNNDPFNCGVCGNSCNGQVCNNGHCCPSGETYCTAGDAKDGAKCYNLKEDVENCGACGNACGQSQTCEEGKCVCTDEDMENCGEYCVMLGTNTNCAFCEDDCSSRTCEDDGSGRYSCAGCESGSSSGMTGNVIFELFGINRNSLTARVITGFASQGESGCCDPNDPTNCNPCEKDPQVCDPCYMSADPNCGDCSGDDCNCGDGFDNGDSRIVSECPDGTPEEWEECVYGTVNSYSSVCDEECVSECTGSSGGSVDSCNGNTLVSCYEAGTEADGVTPCYKKSETDCTSSSMICEEKDGSASCVTGCEMAPTGGSGNTGGNRDPTRDPNNPTNNPSNWGNILKAAFDRANLNRNGLVLNPPVPEYKQNLLNYLNYLKEVASREDMDFVSWGIDLTLLQVVYFLPGTNPGEVTQSEAALNIVSLGGVGGIRKAVGAVDEVVSAVVPKAKVAEEAALASSLKNSPGVWESASGASQILPTPSNIFTSGGRTPQAIGGGVNPKVQVAGRDVVFKDPNPTLLTKALDPKLLPDGTKTKLVEKVKSLAEKKLDSLKKEVDSLKKEVDSAQGNDKLEKIWKLAQKEEALVEKQVWLRELEDTPDAILQKRYGDLINSPELFAEDGIEINRRAWAKVSSDLEDFADELGRRAFESPAVKAAREEAYKRFGVLKDLADENPSYTGALVDKIKGMPRDPVLDEWATSQAKRLKLDDLKDVPGFDDVYIYRGTTTKALTEQGGLDASKIGDKYKVSPDSDLYGVDFSTKPTVANGYAFDDPIVIKVKLKDVLEYSEKNPGIIEAVGARSDVSEGLGHITIFLRGKMNDASMFNFFRPGRVISGRRG